MSPGKGPSRWTQPADIADRLRSSWSRGQLLRAHAAHEPFAALEFPLRRPSSDDLIEHLDEVRRWANRLVQASEDGRAFHLRYGSVGGRYVGRSELPSRVRIDTYEQAWRLLGVRKDVERFDEVLRLSAAAPAAHRWALAHPIRSLALAEEWPALLAALEWLDWHRDTGRYLREIDAPGVDTKFVERHRSVLAEMLGVPASANKFASALGLAVKPGTVRLRFDPQALSLPAVFTEATFRVEELNALRPQVSRAIIVENEITYLSLPVPAGGVVIWGRGYDAEAPASLAWLAGVAERGDAHYWGDIDTHGFAILNRVRTHLPGVRSMLMDRDTLLKHEPRWGAEDRPTNARLPELTDAEEALYADLVTDRFGPSIRLEQERIDWAWAMRRVP